MEISQWIQPEPAFCAEGAVPWRRLFDAAGKTIEDHARLMTTEKPGLARGTLMESLIERVTVENWESVFEVMWRARQEGMISEREEQLFLQRAGEVAGVAAINRFMPAGSVKDWETHSGCHAMRGWAQVDSAAAMAWLDIHPAGNYRTGMTQGFVRGCAAQDPKAALQVTAMLGAGDQQWLMNSMLTVEEAPHYVPFAQQWLISGTPEDGTQETMQIRAQVFSVLAEAKTKALWNDRNGERLTQWAEQFAGRDFVSAHALSMLVERLSERTDAPKVINLIERMAVPVAPGESDLIYAVMQRWSRQDAGAAQQWLNDHQDSRSYDAAVLSFIRNAPSADPVVQRAWIETLHDETLHAQTRRQFDEAKR